MGSYDPFKQVDDLTSGDWKKTGRAMLPGASGATAVVEAAGGYDPLGGPETQNTRTGGGGSNGFDNRPEMTRQSFDVGAHQIDPNSVGLDVSKYGNQLTSINTLQNRANAATESPWLKMQLEKQGLEEAQGKGAAATAGMQGQAQARAGLAMRGGLSGGARERLATGGARDIAAAQQGVGAQGAQNRLGLQIKEEDTKLDLQKALPGQELERNKFLAGIEQNTKQDQLALKKYNTGLAMGEADKANAFTMGKYGNDMSGYAANQASNAIANSGGSKKKGS